MELNSMFSKYTVELIKKKSSLKGKAFSSVVYAMLLQFHLGYESSCFQLSESSEVSGA